MAKSGKIAQRTPSFDTDLKATLAHEFEDSIVVRSVPAENDRHAIEQYGAAVRRRAFTEYRPGKHGLSLSELSAANEQTLFNQTWRELVRTHASKISPEFALPVRRAAGLYDYYPSRLPPPHAFGEPYSLPFQFWADFPQKSTITILVPQVDSGLFYSSIHMLNTPIARTAQAWCGTLITIDPLLHDSQHGPRDVVVWAEGTVQYEYKLEATPGTRWNAQQEAAEINVAIMARLLRYDKQTGQRMTDPEAILAYLATRTIVSTSLRPNGQTQLANLPSSPPPIVGGPYAAWTTAQEPFQIELDHGMPRMLRTDSFYYVAVLCSVSAATKSAGQQPDDAATANGSAQMFLRLVTLGIRPHDPKVL